MSGKRVFINGIEAGIKKGISILEAAHSAAIYILIAVCRQNATQASPVTADKG